MIAICAHRGGALLWPENSLRAFREAASLAIEELECDVHLSADGVAMVHHDATLDRMTDATGPLSALNADALSNIRIKGTDEGIPRLSALLELVAQSGKLLRLEIKENHDKRFDPRLLGAVMDDLSRLPARVRLMSFMPAALLESRFPDKDFLIGPAFLGWHSGWTLNALVAMLGCNGVGFGYDAKNLPRLLEASRGTTNIWRADDKATLRAAFAMAPSSITTDDPVLALRLRQEMHV
ncbi:MAG: glycerophosphodiester phosphodiesterase family protein [Alphaproteobacteria bacterium]|nr:glycerophosphodiester phosphodiesterase family protein [Alphaproteobacteria bacterium]